MLKSKYSDTRLHLCSTTCYPPKREQDVLILESVTEPTGRPMITHTTLSSIANSLGAMAAFLVVVYHILAVNARHLEAVEAQNKEQ